MGHTGNECDQCFSIIASELKSEDILTVEDLKQKIGSASVNPKPVVRDLEFIYDWKSYVLPFLSDPALANHTRYNSSW